MHARCVPIVPYISERSLALHARLLDSIIVTLVSEVLNRPQYTSQKCDGSRMRHRCVSSCMQDPVSDPEEDRQSNQRYRPLSLGFVETSKPKNLTVGQTRRR